MLTILPLLVLITICLNLKSRAQGLRESVIQSLTLMGALVVVITETLSLLGRFTAAGIASAYLIALVAALARLGYVRVVRGRSPAGMGGPRATEAPNPATGMDTGALLLLFGAGVVIAMVGMVALLSPPNVWDVMSAHMPRVFFWLQNRSVQFYPTSEVQQLFMPPFSEFMVSHLHALSGGDRFDNLVQWGAMAGSAVGVSLIARRLGADTRGQAFAALLSATIPQGIMSASNPKNDFVLAFWLVAMVHYSLEYGAQAERRSAMGVGASFGLACLTKGTGFLFAPVLLAALVTTWQSGTWRIRLRHGLWMAMIVLALNAGQFARNHQLFGSILGPGKVYGCTYTNESFTARTLVSNTVGNLVLHLVTPSERVNAALERWTRGLLEHLGIDPDDQRTTWCFSKFGVPLNRLLEGMGGNPLHLLLILGSIAMVPWVRRLRSGRALAAVSGGLVVAFLLFCLAFRWQPFNARLHLPLFVLGCAVAATVSSSMLPRWAIGLTATLLVLSAVPALVSNELRPLVKLGQHGATQSILTSSRTDLRFAAVPYLQESYSAAAALATEHACREVGLDDPSGSYIYPLLVLLKEREPAVRVTFLEASDRRPTKSYPNLTPRLSGEAGPGDPCAVICLACASERTRWAAYLAAGWRATVLQDVVVLKPAPR